MSRKRKPKRQPMGLGRKILLMICLIVFVGSAGVILDYIVKGLREQSALDKVGELRSDTREDLVTDKGTVIGKYADLYLKNKDLIGWVTVDGTRIDYPVMQTQDDPEFYLHRNFDKEYTASGTPFMDALSDIFVPTSNFLVYGHHMKNGTMFKDLLKYDDAEFYRSHRTFRFDTIYKGGQGTYQVIAAGYSKIYPESSDAFKYYQYAGMTTEDSFNEYIEGVKRISSYDTGETATFGDQLVTLSTCAYHTENGRFFVVGRRTDAKQVKPQ